MKEKTCIVVFGPIHGTQRIAGHTLNKTAMWYDRLDMAKRHHPVHATHAHAPNTFHHDDDNDTSIMDRDHWSKCFGPEFQIGVQGPWDPRQGRGGSSRSAISRNFSQLPKLIPLHWRTRVTNQSTRSDFLVQGMTAAAQLVHHVVTSHNPNRTIPAPHDAWCMVSWSCST